MSRGKPREAWVTFDVRVSQETRRKGRDVVGAPIHVAVSVYAIGYDLGREYRRQLVELSYPVAADFRLAGAPEYAAELAVSAIRQAYPGLF